MKKMLPLALSCLLFASLLSTALADQWLQSVTPTPSTRGPGLSGGVYDVVTQDSRYDGYTAVADDGNDYQSGWHVNHAVLQNRYHAVLIAAYREDGRWKARNISTTAVYQPGSVPEGLASPTLTHQDGGFVLSYGEEVYTFLRGEDQQYYLERAEFHPDDVYTYTSSLVWQPEGMLLWQSGYGGDFEPVGDALWQISSISLAEFNIAQTPRTMEEVRNMTTVTLALDAHAEPLQAAFTWEGEAKGRKLPVYAAPSAASYRAAEGKASVSMAEEVQIYGVEDGWTLVSYEVSGRTSRFGYIEGAYAGGQRLQLAEVELVAAADTFLTDDPFVSQYAQAYIGKGAALTGLARCGAYYAYCEFTLGDTVYRGFVPLKDLTTRYDTAMTTGGDQLMADVCWDVMDALTGKWESSDDEGSGRLIFFCGGEYRNHMPGDGASYREVGNYRIYAGENGGYRLLIRTEDNRESHYELTLNADGTITLTDESGLSVVHRRDEFSTYGNG